VRQVYFLAITAANPASRGFAETETEQEIVMAAGPRYHAVLSVPAKPNVTRGAYTYGRQFERAYGSATVKESVCCGDYACKRGRLDGLDPRPSRGIHWLGMSIRNNQTLIANNEKCPEAAPCADRSSAVVRYWQVLLRCGHCGERAFLAQYPGPTVIRFISARVISSNRDRACCVMFGGLRADQQVAETSAAVPGSAGALQAAIEATQNLQSKEDARVRHQELALEAGAL